MKPTTPKVVAYGIDMAYHAFERCEATHTQLQRATVHRQVPKISSKMEFDMKRAMIAALAFVALLGIGSGLMRSSSLFTHGQTTGIGTSKPQPSEAIHGSELPVQDFEDRSLVFPRETKP
jgi:hypothetical protein